MFTSRKFSVLIPVLFCVICSATSPPPFGGECNLVDRIYAAVGNEATRHDAVEVLENVATGQFGLRDYAALSKMGINIDVSGGMRLSMGELIVRERALDHLGRSGLDVAERFLSGLTRQDSDQVWGAVQVALQRCRFTRITDSQARIDFLETTAKREQGNVGYWATEELCNRGIQSSLPVIKASIRRRLSGPPGDDEIAFCEDRMNWLATSGNRVQALSRALRAVKVGSDPKLPRWAAYQLIELDSPEADRALDRFGREVMALTARSPKRAYAVMFWDEIKRARRQR